MAQEEAEAHSQGGGRTKDWYFLGTGEERHHLMGRGKEGAGRTKIEDWGEEGRRDTVAEGNRGDKKLASGAESVSCRKQETDRRVSKGKGEGERGNWEKKSSVVGGRADIGTKTEERKKSETSTREGD